MRLVATDLDGTIVRPDGSVSPRTVEAFDRCRADGVRIVFVTGRPVRWIADVAAQTGHDGVAICANGAVVYDVARQSVRTVHPVAPQAVQDAVAVLRRRLGEVDVALETTDGFCLEPGYRTRWDAGTPPVARAPLDELLAGGPVVLKVLVRAEGSTADAMLAVARSALDGTVQATHSNAHDCLLELSAAGLSKARTLAEHVRELGLEAADVVAFGDMPNDVEMLTWAGAGFAMTGGHPEAVAAAGRTAPSVLDDGVAVVLEDYLARS